MNVLIKTLEILLEYMQHTLTGINATYTLTDTQSTFTGTWSTRIRILFKSFEKLIN